MLKFLKRRWSSDRKFSHHEQELELSIIKLVVGMMKIDNKLDKRERDGIVRLVSKHFEISVDAAETLLLELPQTEGDAPRFRQLAQQIKRKFSQHEAAMLLGEVWSVAESGGHKDCYEKRYISRISGLLGISAKALAEAKSHCKAP